LLFCLIALGLRVILQIRSDRFIVFDNGVHEAIGWGITTYYKKDKPYCLLVSADGDLHPSEFAGFCYPAIVVSSPNLKEKKPLREWRKQQRARTFITPEPSCCEVVYLLYVEF
jgi:hypothetical protein